jgi:hypothetical protein
MKLSQDQKDAIIKLQENSNLETDLLYIIEESDAENIDELADYIEEQTNGFQVEIIYYARAMDYLLENDPSLQYSLEIAHEYGYTTDKLNSELLASLLASQNERENFDEIRDDLEAILYPTTDEK